MRPLAFPFVSNARELRDLNERLNLRNRPHGAMPYP